MVKLRLGEVSLTAQGYMVGAGSHTQALVTVPLTLILSSHYEGHLYGDIWNWDVLEELAAEQGQEGVGRE